MNAFALQKRIQKRHNLLVMRAASYGLNTPPEVSMELEDSTKLLRALAAAIGAARARQGADVLTPLEARVRRAGQYMGLDFDTLEYIEEA